MSSASTLLMLCCLFADDDKADTLRYLREVNNTFLAESEVSTTTNADGKVYKSRTDRGKEGVTTLTVRYDAKNQLKSAEVLQESSKGKKSATLVLPDAKGGRLQVKRGGLSDLLKGSEDPIVSTTPDWSDVFQLVRRYDGKKGGRQEFSGVWIHPTEEPRVMTLSIERVAPPDTITLKDRAIVLDRFRLKLRGGEYLAWADQSGQVCKIVSLERKSAPVVLKGYEEATRELAK